MTPYKKDTIWNYNVRWLLLLLTSFRGALWLADVDHVTRTKKADCSGLWRLFWWTWRPSIWTIFGTNAYFNVLNNFGLYHFLLKCLFLPKDGPPQILLGAPVVGPRTGFTPTPWVNRFDLWELGQLIELLKQNFLQTLLYSILNLCFNIQVETANRTQQIFSLF